MGSDDGKAPCEAVTANLPLPDALRYANARVVRKLTPLTLTSLIGLPIRSHPWKALYS